MAELTFIGMGIVGLVVLLHAAFRPVRRVRGYRPLWLTVFGLSLLWAAFGALTGYYFFRFATQDFSGPSGNVGLYLLLLTVPAAIMIVPPIILLPALLLAAPQKDQQSSLVKMLWMVVVMIPILLVQAVVLGTFSWRLLTGQLKALLLR